MAFWEQEFPTPVGFQAVGGPGFSTAVNLGFSGQEQRNRNWAKARGKWTISLKTPSKDQWSGTHQAFIDMVIAFFTNVGGQADSFRFKDHKDFQARSQPLQPNAGGALQLARTRTLGGRSYVQFISKPITSSVTNYKGVASAEYRFSGRHFDTRRRGLHDRNCHRANRWRPRRFRLSLSVSAGK